MLKNLVALLKTMLTGGLFFLVPLVLFLFVAGKAFNFAQRLIHPLLKNFHDLQVLGIALQDLLGIVLLLLICLMAGALATIGPLRKFSAWLESTFLIHLPGYAITRNLTAEIMNAEDKAGVKVVLVRTGCGWEPGFLMNPRKLDNGYATVFVPHAPGARSGHVLLVDPDHLVITNVGVREALKCIRQGGIGAEVLFAD